MTANLIRKEPTMDESIATKTVTPSLTVKTAKFINMLAAQNNPPLYELTPEAARKVLIDAQSGNVRKPDVSIKDTTLQVGPTGSVDVRIVRPKDSVGKLPGILYIHGGGWILGNKDTHDRLVRELAVGAGATVIYPNYTPSPEAKYPVPIEQCYAVLEYVTKNSDMFDISPDGIIVSGDSVGGNMATAMALMSQDRNGPKIIFQMLFYPVTNSQLTSRSYSDFAEGPWLTKKAMEWFWDAYLPEGDRGDDTYASPLRASEDVLAKLPPALIITAENDVLRDEGEAYAKKLDKAGVDVTSVRVNGTMHDFVMLDALADTGPARTAVTLAIAAIRKSLKPIVGHC